MGKSRTDFINEARRESDIRCQVVYDAGYTAGYEDGKEAGIKERLADDSKSYDNLVPTYEDGLREAWELAKKIVLNKDNDGLTVAEIEKIYGCCAYDAFKTYDVEEMLRRFNQYIEEKGVKAGDILEEKGNEGRKIIVTQIDRNGRISGIEKDGRAVLERDARDWKQTGEEYRGLFETLYQKL